MRILLVSQLYPGARDPDLGVFVRDLETQLVARGHVVERAVLDRRAGGKLRYLELARGTLTRARTFRPDVVYAHFLVPTGLIGALAARGPLVVTAHGRDVRNVGS
ncbi:MAG TPA: glycosyltransferase, partial [Gaiellaceae bacterium]|nr:glycosyltransferase [Gaiellaceae bacterium]